MRAIILAAGRGQRMGEHTRAVPKPLLGLGPETLIERHVRRLVEAGVGELVVNLSYRGDQIRARLGNGSRLGARIEYSDEGEPPLETGGGIIAALPLLGPGRFLVVNADVVSDYPLAALARYRWSNGIAGHLVLVPNPSHHAGGDFGLDESGHATSNPPLWTFAGISMLDPALFDGCTPGRQPLKPILDRAIAARRLTGEAYHGAWIDVGTPERLAQARTRFGRPVDDPIVGD